MRRFLTAPVAYGGLTSALRLLPLFAPYRRTPVSMSIRRCVGKVDPDFRRGGEKGMTFAPLASWRFISFSSPSMGEEEIERDSARFQVGVMLHAGGLITPTRSKLRFSHP